VSLAGKEIQMSSLLPGVHGWAKAPAAFSIAATAFGGVLAAFWCLIAGLWTFSTADYGAFAGITAITAVLLGSPVLGFQLASTGRMLWSLVATLPALLLYCATLITVLWR